MANVTEHDVLAAIDAKKGTARLLGGRAVRQVCGEAMPANLRRHSDDIDLVTNGRSRGALKSALAALHCTPDAEFNLLNGKERMIFHAGTTKIDIFIDVFRMCHTLSLANRLTLHPLTLPPADLMLTKLQVVKLDRKDLIDLAALLLACPQGGTATNAIDVNHIGKTLATDWGIWRTATGTLATLRAEAGTLCDGPDQLNSLINRIDALTAIIAHAPKSLSWRMRSVIGERSIWYELPEEPDVTANIVAAS